MEWLGENSADGFGSFYKITKDGKIAYLDLSNNFAHDLISQCRLFQDEARNGPYLSVGGELDSDDQATGRIAAALGVDIPFQGASLKNSDERELNQAQKNALKEYREIHRMLRNATRGLKFGDERWILEPLPNRPAPEEGTTMLVRIDLESVLTKLQDFIKKTNITKQLKAQD